MSRLRRLIFGISTEEATFDRRGFRSRDVHLRLRLERVGRTFLDGYHAALEAKDDAALSRRLDSVEAEVRGFAYEGAGMALALLDLLKPWGRKRLQTFIAGPGSAHDYMMHVGAGWALARLRRQPPKALAGFDTLLRWLAVDGYGFHEGYFRWPDYVVRQKTPRLNGYARRAFDQGLGRSLWFVEGADTERLPAVVNNFAESRLPDLWSGVGLACAYAGGPDDARIESLRKSAGRFSTHLAQGVVFAAAARERAGNMVEHTRAACRVLCDLTTEEAAALADSARQQLPDDQDVPAYEVWRRRIANEFARPGVVGGAPSRASGRARALSVLKEQSI